MAYVPVSGTALQHGLAAGMGPLRNHVFEHVLAKCEALCEAGFCFKAPSLGKQIRGRIRAAMEVGRLSLPSSGLSLKDQ